MARIFGILGAGGHAREVASYATADVAFFAVTQEFLQDGLIDIARPTPEQSDAAVVAALGAPQTRRDLLKLWPGHHMTNIIAATSFVSTAAKLGLGCQIAPHAVIMTGCRLGDHVVINAGATISHDCTLSNFATVSPGAHIGGHVTIGPGAFIGIGATIRDGLTVAAGAVIGAGAVLIKDAATVSGVYIGNPARLIRTNPGWLSEI